MPQLRIKVMIQRIAFMRNQSVYLINSHMKREDIFKLKIGNKSLHELVLI